MPKLYEIDGTAFGDFAGFAEHVSRRVFPQHHWHGNLDALNDMLRGGFGTPDEGFVLRIKSADVARKTLGYPETVLWLQECATTCHPSNRDYVLERLQAARRGEGATLFDMILEIIREHVPGGSEAESRVELELK